MRSSDNSGKRSYCYGPCGKPRTIRDSNAITAYFDESGIHKGDHLCVVAGFVGNDAQWLSFIHDWIAALKPRPNLPVKFIWGFEV
jgi:hypothetical protein